MKTPNLALKRTVVLACLGLAIPALGLSETPEESPDKTLSPYFFVKSDNPEVDQLPLKSTRADVTISGVMADIQVTQVYKNEGKHVLEAVYVFPASTRAAVHAMKMTIGERTIVAQVQEKQKARAQYEQALSEGKTASLLEQQRPNVFQMNVGNILPGDEIKVMLNYAEALVPQDGVYEFVYPTVVGPRYADQPAANAPAPEKWVANPYLHSGEAAPFAFGFDLSLHSGLPIAKVSSPSHALEINYTDKQNAHVTLKDGAAAGNKDVVIRYALSGGQIESGLLLHRGKQENFFLMMLEPPQRVPSSLIVPREYVFVVDVSGSMHGFPLEVSKALMKDLLGGLRPTDFFNVMLFSGGNSVLSEHSLPATKANLQKALDTVDQQQGGGGTELMPALRAAMALPRAEENISRSLIVVTDGYVTVEKEAFEYVRTHLNRGNVFSFGIGSSVNRYLMEGLAHAGMGEPFIILNAEQAQAKARAFKEYIEAPVLTDIRVEFQGLNVSEVEPASLPDLFARKPVLVFGKYTGAARGKIVITGKTAGRPYRREVEINEDQNTSDNPALRYLWARHRILTLADMNRLDPSDARVKQVTQLGLDYNLLTDYTSFVAIDSLKRTDGGHRITVQQPLPLPEGVSDLAVGGSVPACAPAPGYVQEKRGYYRALGCAAPEKSAACETRAQKDSTRTEDEPAKSESPRIEYALAVQSGNLKPAEAELALAALKIKLRKVIAGHIGQGLVRIKLRIDARGKITAWEIEKDTLQSTACLAALRQEIGRAVFPKAPQGAVVILTLQVK
ncbi:MAG: VWA domain-containing protein [Candidatus Firestonebacteria bacterium]|nr:VWA domain-containing protein [Candidatus Firestonebacteria bacterium]